MRRGILFLAGIAVLLFSTFDAQANQPIRPSDPIHLGDRVTLNQMVRVEGATVAWVNFELLRHDFPVLKEKSDPEIEAWILKNFAFISEDQLRLNGIRQSNIPIQNNSNPQNTKWGYRPDSYGRAAVLEARGGDNRTVGLVDVKGAGRASNNLSGWTVDAQIARFQQVQNSPEDLDQLR